MKLKCNVCNESPTIDTKDFKANDLDLICCPSCDKQMAYSGQRFGSHIYEWFPLGTYTVINKVTGLTAIERID